MTSPASPKRTAGSSAAGVAAGLAGAVVFTVACWARTAAPIGAYIDDGFYAILGRALATGQGLRYLHWPGAPIVGHYPPGYPAVLALAWRLTGSLHGVAQWGLTFNAACLAVAAAAICLGLIRAFAVPTPVAVIVAIGGALAPPVVAVTTLLLSEPLFLALGLATLWAASPTSIEPRHARPGRAVLAGLLGAAATLVRALGGAFLVAAVLGALVQRRSRDAVLTALAGLLLLAPYFAWRAAHPPADLGPLAIAYGSYVGYVADAVRQQGPGFLAGVARTNILALTRTARVLFAPWPSAWWTIPVLVALLALAAAGVRATWRKAPAIALSLGLYVAIVVCWPYDPSRFLWGIWPIVLGVLALGAVDLAGRSPTDPPRPAVLRWAALSAVVLVTFGYLRTTVQGLAARGWEASQLSAVARVGPVVAWVRNQTPPDAVIATPYDPTVYLYSGRRAIPIRTWRATDYLTPGRDAHGDDDLRAILTYFHPSFVILPGQAGVVAGRLAGLLDGAPVTIRPVADLAGGNAVLALDWRPAR